jgi:hypothetical protein
MADEPLGWTITVQLPDGSTPRIYNVALPNEREAIEAVRLVLSDTKDTIIKVRQALQEEACSQPRIVSGSSRRRPDRERDPCRDQSDDDPGPHVIRIRGVIVPWLSLCLVHSHTDLTQSESSEFRTEKLEHRRKSWPAVRTWRR